MSRFRARQKPGSPAANIELLQHYIERIRKGELLAVGVCGVAKTKAGYATVSDWGCSKETGLQLMAATHVLSMDMHAAMSAAPTLHEEEE